jgi:hypothetical protein
MLGKFKSLGFTLTIRIITKVLVCTDGVRHSQFFKFSNYMFAFLDSTYLSVFVHQSMDVVCNSLPALLGVESSQVFGLGLRVVGHTETNASCILLRNRAPSP